MKLSYKIAVAAVTTIFIGITAAQLWETPDKPILFEEDNRPIPDESRDKEGDTYSIVAYDKTTGQVGGSGCSCVNISGNIDFLSDLITDGTTNSDNIVGAIHSQASYNATYQTYARNEMLAGNTPQDIVDATVAADAGSASRQYGVVGVKYRAPGDVAAGWSGSSNGNYANDIQYDDANFTVSIQGNILDTSAGGGQDDILNDMLSGFLNTDGTLAERLLGAMQGAKRVGADNRCEGRGNSGRMAFIQVLSPGETSPSIFYTTGSSAVADGIEPIDELQCTYEAAYAPSSCRGTVNTFPYNMDFEDEVWIKDFSNCGLASATNSWIRTRHDTPTTNTGPSGPSNGNMYMFIEADQGTNDKALITSPCLEIPAGETTLVNFDYHMYGATMGSLTLEIYDSGSWSTLWTLSGDQGNSWNSASIDLTSYAGNTIKLRFDGTTASGNTSDMAVDNISVFHPEPVTCTNTVSTFDYSESFESGIGLWVQATGDAGDWIEYTGSTPSNNTGPSAASNGSQYLYIEASNNGTPGEIGSNASAVLESPCFDLSAAPSAEFSFDYHSYGGNTGSIQLDVSVNEGVWANVWSISAINNNAWVPVTVDLSAYLGEVIKLRFTGRTGNSWDSDLALDNFGLAASCGSATEYTGGSWSAGAPDISNEVTITDNYSTASDGGSIEACTITVASGATLRIGQGDYLKVNGNIVVDGTLIVDHEGSVVQIDDDATVTNNGTINVDTTSPNLGSRDFMVLGSPMSGETRTDVWNSAFLVLNHLTGNFVPNPDVEALMPGAENFADDNYDNWVVYNGAINPGEGYIVRPQAGYGQPGGVFNYTYDTGTLNNGVVSFDVQYNQPTSGADDAADKNASPNVVSNPYPSAIDANAFIAANDMVDEIYFWEHITPPSPGIPGAGSMNFSMEDISMRNGTGGIAATNDLVTVDGPTYNRYISTSQGFAFKANLAEVISNGGAITDDVVFNNAMRVDANNDNLREPESKDRVWIAIGNSEYNMKRTTLVGFLEEATPGMDNGYDSRRMATMLSIYSHLQDGSGELGIQAREAFDSRMKVELGFSSLIDTNTQYKISIDYIEGPNLENATVYLRDALNPAYGLHNLSEAPYTFTSEATTDHNRFTILFEGEEELGIGDVLANSVGIYPNPTEGQLNISAPNTAIRSVQLIDLSGRVVAQFNNDGSDRLVMDLSAFNASVYFVNIDTDQGSVVKKLIKR